MAASTSASTGLPGLGVQAERQGRHRTPAIWISNGTGRDGSARRHAPKVGWCCVQTQGLTSSLLVEDAPAEAAA